MLIKSIQDEVESLTNNMNSGNSEIETKVSQLKQKLHDNQVLADEKLEKLKYKMNLKKEKILKAEEEAIMRRDKAKFLHQSKGGRQSEIDLINRLEEMLNIRNQQLANHIKDIKAYKDELVNNDETFNERFGQTAAVKIILPHCRRNSSSGISRHVRTIPARPFTAAPELTHGRQTPTIRRTLV